MDEDSAGSFSDQLRKAKHQRQLANHIGHFHGANNNYASPHIQQQSNSNMVVTRTTNGDADQENDYEEAPRPPTVKELKSQISQLKKMQKANTSKISKLEARNDRLEVGKMQADKDHDLLMEKYKKLLSDLKKNRGKSSNDSYNKEIANMVTTKTKRETWRTVKFMCNEKQERKATLMTLDHCRLREYMLTNDPDKDVIIEQKRETFADLYMGACREALNDQRSYVQSQSKDRAFKVLSAGQELFPWELVAKVAARDVPNPEEDKEEYEKFVACFIWYWDELLPAVAGNVYWKPSIRWNQCITIANIDGQACIPVSTEAMAALIYENCCDKWVAIYNYKEGDIKSKKKIPKKKDDQESAQFKGKYSDDASGQAKYGGWSKAGLERFRDLVVAIKAGRASDGTPNLEKFILDQVKLLNHKPETTEVTVTRKRKRGGTVFDDEEEIIIDFDEDE